MSTWFGGAALWGGETYQLVARHGKDAEYEMAGDLRVPRTRTWSPPNSPLRRALVLIDPAADPVTHAPGIDMSARPPGNGILLTGGSGLDFPGHPKPLIRERFGFFWAASQ